MKKQWEGKDLFLTFFSLLFLRLEDKIFLAFLIKRVFFFGFLINKGEMFLDFFSGGRSEHDCYNYYVLTCIKFS